MIYEQDDEVPSAEPECSAEVIIMIEDDLQNTKWIYNFIFPYGCQEVEIYKYTFTRVPEYIERVQTLQHTFSSFSEFDRPMSTGTHAITAEVTIPGNERQPILPWREENATALDDILLLFSIFTQRDVFALKKPMGEGEGAITADSRMYYFGLMASIPYEEGGEENGRKCDIGFQKGIETVYKLMRTDEWRKEYGNGRFLSLFRSACKIQILETSFITCWTIWEILFRLHNNTWLSDKQMIRLPAAEKIAFILTRYEIKKSVNATYRKGIKRFVKIRNNLVHSGRFLDERAIHDAMLFVQVTTIIIAKILGLSGHDVLDSETKLLARLQGQEVMPIWKALQ